MEILHALLSSANFFQNQLFRKSSFRNTTWVSNSLDPDQTRHIVGPDLGLNFCKDYQQMSLVGKELYYLNALYSILNL